ncbi:MAG: DUF4418 family protein [Treponema sp.]|jgi:hypothetical protein|nr:DUF4418 family protein [Treponema sp.]
MKKRITGIVFTVLGLLIALGPQFLFKVCQPIEDIFMKCHWSAQAEIGVGAVTAVLGIALIIFTSVKVRLGLVIGILLSGVHALLIPHALIGGCTMDSMTCRKITFPAITVISILLIVVAGIYTAYLARKQD